MSGTVLTETIFVAGARPLHVQERRLLDFPAIMGITFSSPWFTRDQPHRRSLLRVRSSIPGSCGSERPGGARTPAQGAGNAAGRPAAAAAALLRRYRLAVLGAILVVAWIVIAILSP
ncbi:MAG: hypothetical protein R3D25_13425 [Geminicoccaceae bacterium]